ncbi:TonB-dependent receptor [plant metagenome]|uniref:TonB-dependent receptor n=1 Tax=plant metagenome TaxID=1297885 RepID=A0A484PAG0_9ZZZZ
MTGTRLQHGDVTSKVIIIDQEDIKSRGVTSITELIRTLPQNLATIGDITNERAKGPLGSSTRGRTRAPSALGTLGVSAANLGGMGAGNTLVLINGRRIAGAAGIEDGFVNLNGIPLSAVERVEINLDGSSAVYGSDAMGGVINFILKRNFVGSTLSVQHEYSSNDADNSRISLYSGYAWNSGSISATLDRSERKPVNNWKTGYVTENYRDYFNGDPAYDYRSFSRGLQPGVIDTSYYYWDPVTQTGYNVAQGLTLPAGFTGVPTIDDFVVIGPEGKRDVVPELAGPESETNSVTLNFEQQITDKLRFTADGLYSRSENSQEQNFNNGALNLMLAPGQYYNPFPAYHFNAWTPGTSVAYYPEAEIEAGELPPGMLTNTTTSWSANLALSYQFTQKTKLELLYSTSASKNEGDSRHFGNLVSFVDDPNSPTGLSCYNFFLANNRYSGDQLARYQQAFDRQCQALTSTDPNLAFNPWKSSADGGGSSVSDFYYLVDDEQRSSRTQNWELRLNGSLYPLPAGDIYYVVGGEWHEDGIDSNEVRNYTGEVVSRDRHAYFAEFTVPVFGHDFTLPGVKSLTLNLAARHDSYDTEGAIGTVDGIPLDLGGEIIYGKNTFSKTTPSFGFRWEVVDGLALRGRWTRGFQAPPLTNLFDVSGSYTYNTIIWNGSDPLYSCTTDCDVDYGPNSRGYYVPNNSAPNPDLKPQSSIQRSLSLSWYPSGVLEGLTLDVSWHRNRIYDEYANRGTLASFLPVADIYAIEQFYPRDANGKILAQQNMIFNIQGSEYESVSYELGYHFASRWGTFEPKVTYLDNLKAERRVNKDVPAISTLGHLLGVDDYKIVGSMRWLYRDVSATLWANYTPGYINDYELFQVAGVVTNPDYAKPVGSYLTYDLTVSWQMRNDLRLNIAGRNLLDKDPRFVVVGGRPYDTARYNVAGRTLSLELQYDF